MAWDVHIHVCFPCDRNDDVAAIARKHLQDRGSLDREEARFFLEDLAARSGGNRSHKGGLSMWGMVGNNTNVALFCEALLPFWSDLLRGGIDSPDYGGPSEFERVIVFEEREQADAATAYQIALSEDETAVKIKCFPDLPFSWGQA